MPEPVTIDAIEPAFTKAGLDAIKEVSMVVNGPNLSAYEFDNEGKIVEESAPSLEDIFISHIRPGDLAAIPMSAKPKFWGRDDGV